ncbi:MAG: AMP-binding protein [Pseudomonadales bacterium]|nr:AMP-binding protein [Pseudomonadales bacterium]
MIPPYSHYPARAARHWPDRIAVVDGQRSCTYAELDARATAMAITLQQQGLRVGDRVAVLQQNRLEYVLAVIAVARAGGVLVPLLGALTATEHRHILRDCTAAFGIALSPERAPHLRDVADGTLRLLAFGAVPDMVNLNLTQPGDAIALEPVDRPPAELAQILYTSGTTGLPKGVTHSYASVAAAMNFWAQTFDLGTDDALLGQLPLSHFGGRAMDSCWVAGARLVILHEAKPALILQTIAEQRITMMLVVPTLLRMLLDDSAAASCNLDSLRAVVYAASPAAPALVQRAGERLGSVLYTGFGQTEAYGLNTLMGPAEHDQALTSAGNRLSSVGRQCPAAQVRLCDEFGTDVPLGEVGEIWVCAPWTTPGFWQRPDLDAQRLQRGWLRTGDLGRMDDQGYIYLADRREDMIISGGFNIYPAEVENCLMNHSAIAECGVFSVPDPKWGEAVHASVVLRTGASATADEIIEFARQSLTRYKVPKEIHIVDLLPKTAVGKILRRELRAPFWDKSQNAIHGPE